MKIIIGLLIIAIGAFCQSSSYVPINKIKSWSWESYWLVQGVFAWLIFPLAGALMAVPEGYSFFEMFSNSGGRLLPTFIFGMLWGVGGLTFGLSMRYLGVALGQSIALGTCAALGTIMGPALINIFFPEQNALAQLTLAVFAGVAMTLVGIGVIGYAGIMRQRITDQKKSDEGEGSRTKEFNFSRGIIIALLSGFMSGCFNVGLEFGKGIGVSGMSPLFASLPATLVVTCGGFITNAAYCLWMNRKNHTWGDYRQKGVWLNNLVFCALAGLLWYSQFFGLSLGKGFLTESPTLQAFSWCILMALNVVFSNLWGIILKEWKGCSRKTIITLVAGIIILIVATFLPSLI